MNKAPEERTHSGTQDFRDPVGTLKQIEDDTYHDYGVTSRPAGDLWVKIVLDLARRILDTDGLPEALTPAILDDLTENNFHTARHAAELVIHLKRYAM